MSENTGSTEELTTVQTMSDHGTSFVTVRAFLSRSLSIASVLEGNRLLNNQWAPRITVVSSRVVDARETSRRIQNARRWTAEIEVSSPGRVGSFLGSQRKRFPDVVAVDRVQLDRSRNERSTDSKNRRGSFAVKGITEIIPGEDRHGWGTNRAFVELLLLD